jgi:N-ethylmaleimide reductase
MILNEGYDIESARRAIESGQGDAVAFGKAFVSTPDLVQRLVSEAAFQPADLPQALAG